MEKLAPKPTAPKPTAPTLGGGFEGMNTEDLNQGLDVLGGQGWELVAIEPYHEVSTPEGGGTIHLHCPTTYVFKRSR